jgi:hypothetical protein
MRVRVGAVQHSVGRCNASTTTAICVQGAAATTTLQETMHLYEKEPERCRAGAS